MVRVSFSLLPYWWGLQMNMTGAGLDMMSHNAERRPDWWGMMWMMWMMRMVRMVTQSLWGYNHSTRWCRWGQQRINASQGATATPSTRIVRWNGRPSSRSDKASDLRWSGRKDNFFSSLYCMINISHIGINFAYRIIYYY